MASPYTIPVIERRNIRLQVEATRARYKSMFSFRAQIFQIQSVNGSTSSCCDDSGYRGLSHRTSSVESGQSGDQKRWQELTGGLVLVHMLHDVKEHKIRLLACENQKLVINFVDLSPRHTAQALSRKFMQLTCNREQTRAPVYGLGFTSTEEMQQVNEVLLMFRDPTTCRDPPAQELFFFQ